MDIDKLKEIISSEIHENEYWDFKEKWYAKRDNEIVRDIVSFANTAHHKDCYLIMGVSDNQEVIGVENDKNRRNKQQLQDLLRKKPFAQSSYPQTNVETFNVQGHELDVITIYDSDQVPFFLQKKDKDLNAGAVYCRTNDSNTPRDSTATDREIELLWKKRFHEDMDILDQFMYLMKDRSSWEYIENDEYIGFIYKKNPDFQIILKPEENNNRDVEAYSINQFKIAMSYQLIQFRYRTVLIKEYLGAWLDEAKLLVPVPDREMISMFNAESVFYFFTKESYRYKLMKFIVDKMQYNQAVQLGKFLSDVVIFNNEKEVDKFKDSFDQNIIKQIKVSEEEVERLKNSIKISFFADEAKSIIRAYNLEQIIMQNKLTKYIQKIVN